MAGLSTTGDVFLPSPAVDDRVVVRFLDVSMADGDGLALLDGPERRLFRAYPDMPLDTPLFSRYINQ